MFIRVLLLDLEFLKRARASRFLFAIKYPGSFGSPFGSRHNHPYHLLMTENPGSFPLRLLFLGLFQSIILVAILLAKYCQIESLIATRQIHLY